MCPTPPNKSCHAMPSSSVPLFGQSVAHNHSRCLKLKKNNKMPKTTKYTLGPVQFFFWCVLLKNLKFPHNWLTPAWLYFFHAVFFHNFCWFFFSVLVWAVWWRAFIAPPLLFSRISSFKIDIDVLFLLFHTDNIVLLLMGSCAHIFSYSSCRCRRCRRRTVIWYSRYS